MSLRRAAARVLALIRKRRLDQELDGEVLAHLELAERDLVASGATPEEARRIARIRFGGIEQVKEEHRDRRGVRWMDALMRDLRYGFAAVVRNPGFSAAVVGVLALGIGANVAMFSVVDAVLLKPLPFPESHRIVRVWEAPRPGVSNDTSTLDFLDWKRLGTVFEALAAEQQLSVSLTGSGDAVRLSGKAVTGDYFHVFSTPALLGRTITPQDERPESARVVVLSHEAWQTYFGRDPDILNRRPILDGESYQVIGVLAAGRVRSRPGSVLEAAGLHARQALTRIPLAHGNRASSRRRDAGPGYRAHASHPRRADRGRAGVETQRNDRR